MKVVIVRGGAEWGLNELESYNLKKSKYGFGLNVKICHNLSWPMVRYGRTIFNHSGPYLQYIPRIQLEYGHDPVVPLGPPDPSQVPSRD